MTRTKIHSSVSRAAVMIAVAAAFISVASMAHSQPYTPTPPPNVLELNPQNPEPGGSFTGRGCGFAPGSTVTVTIGGQNSGTIVVGPDGCAVGTLRAPTAPGTYTVCFTGLTPGGGPQQLCNTITVSAAQAGAAVTGTTPFTGFRLLLPVGLAGVGLLLIGIAILIVLRRRAYPAV